MEQRRLQVLPGRLCSILYHFSFHIARITSCSALYAPLHGSITQNQPFKKQKLGQADFPGSRIHFLKRVMEIQGQLFGRGYVIFLFFFFFGQSQSHGRGGIQPGSCSAAGHAVYNPRSDGTAIFLDIFASLGCNIQLHQTQSPPVSQ